MLTVDYLNDFPIKICCHMKLGQDSTWNEDNAINERTWMLKGMKL